MAARNLGKHGVDVYIVSEDMQSLAFFSKYCKKNFVIDRPWSCQTLKRILQKIARETSERLVVYPLSDVDTLNLSKIKDDLRDDYILMVGEQEATETLINKRKFYQTLDKNKIEYPVTYFPQDVNSAKHIGSRITYPIFIKPAINEGFLYMFNYQKGFVAHSPKELIQYYRLATSKKIEVMFQEIIHGPPSSSYQLEGYYNKDSCPIGFFARQRLRIWPLGFGNTTLCVSIPLTELAHKCKPVSEFIKRIGYSGLMSAEFKKDQRDGKLKILEINARIWLHFWLSAECGFDILFSSYLDAIGEKTPPFSSYTVGVKSLILANDLRVSAKMFRNGDLSFSDWLSSLQGKKQLALFDKGDLSPCFISYAGFASASFRSARNLLRKKLLNLT